MAFRDVVVGRRLQRELCEAAVEGGMLWLLLLVTHPSDDGVKQNSTKDSVRYLLR